MGQDEPKMVVVQCKCGKKYRVKSRVSDAGFVCKSCGHTIRLTSPVLAAAPPSHWTQNVLMMVWALPVCIAVIGLIFIFVRERDRAVVNPAPAPVAPKPAEHSPNSDMGTTSDHSEVPQLAQAPFNEEQARKHQQVWAEHLGVPVERTIELGDGVDITLVLIPPGEFLMGSTAEEQARYLNQASANGDEKYESRVQGESPEHLVRITRPYFLSKYEVTQGQWEAVMDENPSEYTGEGAESYPVEQVSYIDAQEFMAKLNQQLDDIDGKFSLPSEAQWEYACRAGTATVWYWGDDPSELPKHAWYLDNAEQKTHPVGQLRANPLGLHDIHGNVMEWCQDFFDENYYTDSPIEDPAGPAEGRYQVRRGGGRGDPLWSTRSAFRSYLLRTGTFGHLGFRLALVPEE